MTTSYSIDPLLGPRDLPRLRRHLHDMWHPDRGMAAMFDAWQLARIGDRHGLPEYHWQRAALASASLWWVTDAMTTMLGSAESSLPGDTLLTPDLIPQSSGLVVFETPLPGVDADTGRDGMLIDAMLWGRVRLVDNRVEQVRPGLGIASYRRMNFDDGLTGEEMKIAAASGALQMANPMADPSIPIDIRSVPSDDDPHPMRAIGVGQLHGEIWAPLGRSDWVIGERLDFNNFDLQNEMTLESAMEDRRRLAALWLLASQPGIAQTVEDHGTRPERRRDERAGFKPSPVRIISVPKVIHRDVPVSPSGEGTGRKVGVRFPVEGFWRNQPYGPGRAYRRPTWVPPHWRGPEDAPVQIRPKVRVLRPPQ